MRISEVVEMGEVVNCLFRGNTALTGGAVSIAHNNYTLVTHSTFVANQATDFDGEGVRPPPLSQPAVEHSVVVV